jgi:hypothetical protein
MTAAELNSRIEDVKRRLACEFGGTHAADVVAKCVAEARKGLAGAKVEAFLPVFVARRARSLLRRANQSSPTH